MLKSFGRFRTFRMTQTIIREFGRRHQRIIGDEFFHIFDSEPVNSRYKSKMNEQRRILLQEHEDEDTEVVFWDENTKPEDIMKGKDLENYYAVERMYAIKDSSSTDSQQLKRFNDLSKVLEIDPTEVPGYKTFFQKGESFSSGIPDHIDSAFKYFDKFIQDHPELQDVFYEWQNTVNKVSKINVNKLSDSEFKKLTKCPEVILKHVEPKYRPLFEIHRNDFITQNPKTNPESKKQKSPSPTPSLSEKKDSEESTIQQEGQVNNRIGKTINLMFDSIWQSHIPISISYISTSSRLKDIYVYLSFSPGQANSIMEEVNKVLEENRENFNEMLRIVLHLSKKPNIIFKFQS